MNKRFPTILKDLRDKRNISQTKLAELLDVDRSAIAHWESGDRVPGTKLLMRLAEVLDVDVSILINDPSESNDADIVMIVDDEAIALQGAKKVVSDTLPETTVVTFKRPSDALEYVAANKVTIALLDIEMGKSNGFELSQKIHDINPNTSIFFLTAYPDYALDAWSTFANGFLVKPLKKEALLKQLDMMRSTTN